MKKEAKSITKRIVVVFIMMTLLLSSFTVVEAAAPAKVTKTYEKQCAGVTDINATASVKSNFYVYSSYISYVLNTPYKTYKDKKKISLTCNLGGNNHYYVKIVSPKKTTTSCNVFQHLDKGTVSGKGIKWIAKSDSRHPGNGIIYMKKLYFSKSEVAQALEYIDNNGLLDKQTAMYQVAWFAASTALTVYTKGLFVKALSAAVSLKEIFYGMDFKKLTRKQVEKASGYKYNEKKAKGTAKKGVLITEYFCAGMEFLEVSSWNGVDVSGVKGYSGIWSY